MAKLTEAELLKAKLFLLNEVIPSARRDVSRFIEYAIPEERTGERVRLAPHQRVMLSFIAHPGHAKCVLMIPPGFSKCHGRGTPILMADGSIRAVEAVGRGDRVMGPGGPMEVLCSSRGRGELFRIDPVKGDPFVVNGDHILTLVNTDTGAVIDIPVVDFRSRSRWFQERHKLFHAPVPRFEGEQPLPVDPYFLGLWMADGVHSVRHGVRVTAVDPENVETLREIAERYGLDLNPRNAIDYCIVLRKSDRRRGSKTAGNPLMNDLKKAVQGDRLSMDLVKRAPRAQRIAFLAGFIDGDGGVVKGCVNITQKRYDWAEALAFIARSLGICVTERDVSVPNYGMYRSLILSGEMSFLPMRVARKRIQPRRQIKNALRSGFAITPLGEGDYFGFTIGGDGRYLLGDFTVTHNTFLEYSYAIWLAGHDHSLRGLLVSKAQHQSKKPLRVIGEMIRFNRRVRQVFPDLRPSGSESWSQTGLTIERPPNLRDATFSAVGTDSKSIAGARLNLIIADDLLDDENTNTDLGRQKVIVWFDNLVQTRLDTRSVSGTDSKLIVSNTVWHPKDLLHQLREQGWPTLRMDCEGGVFFYNADPDWESREVRPRVPGKVAPGAEHRLIAHDPDPSCVVPLWPNVFSRPEIEARREKMHPLQFNRAYMSNARDDSSAMCKQEWIDACKARAREAGHHKLRSAPVGGKNSLTFTGLDLAFSKAERSDDTCFFTFEILPDGSRLILDIDIGKFDGPTIVKKIEEKHDRYDSIIRVENNGAQGLMRQWVLDKNKTLPITKHETGRNKAHPEYGVQAIFTELSNHVWLIPNDLRGICPAAVQKWVDGCLYYVPDNHTDDSLMASWFAWEQARIAGALYLKTGGGGGAPIRPASVSAGILAR